MFFIYLWKEGVLTGTRDAFQEVYMLSTLIAINLYWYCWFKLYERIDIWFIALSMDSLKRDVDVNRLKGIIDVFNAVNDWSAVARTLIIDL